ncbi:gustatory receptor 68a-like [Wyeomyia smithii]|uniref:gustatory receptor 68a-like n=1 Tax=Wyeomyia smithii TaxID=174621 RepID=UPI002467C331|nr:gustatory receptor 68a-like [Wyeomyia smithii]
MLTNHQLVKTIGRCVIQPLQRFGVIPLSWDPYRKQFQRSRWLTLASVVFALLFTAGMPLPLWYMIIAIPYSGSGLSAHLVSVQIIVFYVILPFAYASLFINFRQVVLSLNNLAMVYYVVVEDINQIDRNLLKKYLLKIIVVDIILFSVVYTLYIPYGIGKNYLLLISWICNAVNNFVVMMVLNMLQVTAVYGSAMFWNINTKVSEILDHLCHFYVGELFWKLRNQQKLEYRRNIANKIDELCFLHRVLDSNVQRLICAFSFPLLAIFLFLFITILSDMYYDFVLLLKETETGRDLSIGQTVSSALLLLVCLLQFFYAISFCALFTGRAEKTGLLLTKLFQSDLGHRIELSINVFTLETLHHNYSIRLFGLFSLDFTFMYATAATMISYLVLLVQFGLAE